MKKPLVLLGFLGMIVVALLLAQITLVNSLSTTGINLVDIQNQIDTYKKQNEILKVAYLQAASYTNIATQAQKLGYVPVKSEIDLAAPMPLALR